MNVKILVCCHKKDVMATQEPYMPIHVGKALHPELDLGIQGDDTGDNISEKNGSYCELTGMYWAWKNLKNVDAIGLCHYRRYFDFHNQVKWPHNLKHFQTSAFSNMDLSIPDSAIDFVAKRGVILVKPAYYRTNLMADYCCWHISDDFRTLQYVVETTQTDEIRRAFHVVMHETCSLMHYNMFIMRWDMFDEYCTWIFDVLHKVEEQTDISNYNNVQKRIYGYMAERLFNVWAYAKYTRQKKYPVIMFTDSNCIDPSRLHRLINNLRFRICRSILR